MRSIERKRPQNALIYQISKVTAKLAVDVVDSTPCAVYLTPVGHSEVTHMPRFHMSLKFVKSCALRICAIRLAAYRYGYTWMRLI